MSRQQKAETQVITLENQEEGGKDLLHEVLEQTMKKKNDKVKVPRGWTFLPASSTSRKIRVNQTFMAYAKDGNPSEWIKETAGYLPFLIDDEEYSKIKILGESEFVMEEKETQSGCGVGSSKISLFIKTNAPILVKR